MYIRVDYKAELTILKWLEKHSSNGNSEPDVLEILFFPKYCLNTILIMVCSNIWPHNSVLPVMNSLFHYYIIKSLIVIVPDVLWEKHSLGTGSEQGLVSHVEHSHWIMCRWITIH